MAVYRLTDRKFSRLWRRSKDYSDHEIRYLARKRGLKISAHKQVIQVLDPKSQKVVANFKEVAPAMEADNRSERSRLLGALHA